MIQHDYENPEINWSYVASLLMDPFSSNGCEWNEQPLQAVDTACHDKMFIPEEFNDGTEAFVHFQPPPLQKQNSQRLRLKTKQLSKNYTSKYKGVCWYKRTNKWVAQIKYNQMYKHLGYFDSERQAAQAYIDALSNYTGSGAILETAKSVFEQESESACF